MKGVFLVAKERDKTSYEVVEELKEKLQVKKAGHAGTLDPIAEGLLIVGVNEATKLLSLLITNDKEYIAQAQIGIKTDTADITGKTIEKSQKKVTKKQLQEAINNFPRKYNQEVPKYSAKKVAGKKLYQYARNNQTVNLPKKEVFIKEITLLDFDEKTQVFQFKVLVSKGTYIRALIEDIANNLGCLATMISLTRIKQGNFHLQNAKKVAQITKNDLITINELLTAYPKQKIAFEKIANGELLMNEKDYDWLFLVDENDQPLALYQRYEKDKTKLKPWQMLKIK